MINFKSNFINTANVIKYNNNRPENLKTAFVELDSSSEKDKKVVSIISDIWENGQSWAWEIEGNFCNSYNKPKNKFQRFYALTEQLDNFEDLNFYEILGIAQITHKRGERKINYLQVNPEYYHFNSGRKIKGAGTAIIDSVKKLYKGKKIILNSSVQATKFYLKNKFTPITPGSNLMIFKG